MSRKRALSLGDEKSTDSARDKLEQLVGYQLRTVVRNAHNAKQALEKQQRSVREALDSVKPDERSTHFQVLDELRVLCIDSSLPVRKIVSLVRATPARAGNRVNQQLMKDWHRYERDLWRWNEVDLRQTSGESQAFFDEFIARLTFDNLFTNDMWPGDRILEASPNRYPALSNKRQVDLLHFEASPSDSPVAVAAGIETKEEEAAESVFEYSASVNEFVTDVMRHADSKAQWLVLNYFEEHALRPFIQHIKAMLDETARDLGKLTLCDDSPDVNATASLDTLCDATRDMWKSVVQTTDATHDEVKKFLLATQEHMHDLEIKYTERAKRVDYQEPLASWLEGKTDLARTKLSLDHLRRVSAQTDQMIRDSSYVARLLAVLNDTPFAFANKKPKLSAATLEGVSEPLRVAIGEFERRYAEQAAILDEKKSSMEIATQRTEALTCAVHLDYVLWVSAILNAIGQAFIRTEDHEGQLKQRVNRAILESGAPLTAHIDAVRAKEKVVCQRVERELADELKLGQDLFAKFGSWFAGLTKLYELETAHAKAMVHQRVFQHHGPFMKLEFASEEEGKKEARAMAVVLLSEPLIRMDRALIETRMPSVQDHIVSNASTMSNLTNVEKWSRFLIELSVSFMCRVYICDD